MDKKRKKQDRKVISFIPDGEFYYKKAVQALQRERFGDAHKYLKRATELSPNDPLFLMQYGVLVMEEGRFEEAHELLMTAYSLDSTEEEIIFYLAEVHAHLGMLRDAKMYAEKYISLDPDGPFADESMEIIDFAEQEEAFNDDEMPDGEVYFLQEKARRLMESGDFKTAVELLESIIVDHPEFWAAYNNLALAYFYIGKTERASELLHEVLNRNKGNIHALCNLAVFYYYEKQEEELESLLELLVKIKPYQFEHRFKLGSTFALVGRHKEAYNWLRSLQKHGFDGDVGFYFWFAHSAYLSGHEGVARKAFATLVEMDPTKVGYEPWKDVQADIQPDSLEQNRSFLLGKIRNEYRSERMFGFYLLGKSGHKQEIISHPSYIDIEKLSDMERLFLTSGLDYEFMPETAFDKSFIRALETTDMLYSKYRPLDTQATHLFQMWFTLCETALSRSYPFRNPTALAAAADYMFQSSRDTGVTKTTIASTFGISVPTLTKYIGDLIEFLPHFDA
ncbi:tetratricopeptide repeat protein [Sporosarcina limicola]|uniref:Tetratricopeptide (TPR) repeat protein n=1 Tax=Sporosarcina limicola TaxID=34101 RepID=A0A927MI89_9BACL|nr:tetratricopeptide repeat protein [Sporosarcina limicola]MBE1554890.1 tetratricopeptide (TPR) repeat protein [Sporosarcina limicola]